MKNKIKNIIDRVKFAIQNQNQEVLIHGFCSTENSEYWKEKFDRERLKYALENPWVFQYDFGHKEILQKIVNDKTIV